MANDYGDAVTSSGPLTAEQVAGAFSSAVFKELAKETPSHSARTRIALVARSVADEEATLAAAFDHAHRMLVRDYRNEYVFKNGLVSKIVFGHHSPRTATALLELRMGNSWADVFVVNGTSTTYEIKTDLDQFVRLSTQLHDYKTRSEFVNVVTSEKRASAAERLLPSHVGILALRRNGALSRVRAAESNIERMTADDIYLSLRANEAEQVLKDAVGYQLDVPSGHAWKRLRELFAELPIDVAHRGALSELRKRGWSAAELVTSGGFPSSLRALAYSTELSRIGRERVLRRLSSPAALLWEG